MSSTLTVVTDDQGRYPNHVYDREPEPCSIILTEGDHGTAWQRYAKDGLWHRMGGGRPRDWAWIIKQRRVRLVYDAPPRQFDDKGTPLNNWTEARP